MGELFNGIESNINQRETKEFQLSYWSNQFTKPTLDFPNGIKNKNETRREKEIKFILFMNESTPLGGSTAPTKFT